MSSLPDARYEGLAEALRSARPRAGAELRERVAALREDGTGAASARPSLRDRFAIPWRPALVLAPIVVAGVAIGLGIQSSPRGDSEQAASGGEAASATARRHLAEPRERGGVPLAAQGDEEVSLDAFQRGARAAETARSGGAIPPSGRRLQEYRATLRVHVSSVDALSERTTDAMRITRSLGGFVVSADYAAPGDGDGDSRLTVRVPVDKVSTAVLRFSELGTVIGQEVAIQDLQRTYNQQTDRIGALRGTITELERELRRPDLDVEARIRLQNRLANARAQLRSALDGRSATLRRGRLATVSLTLTTREGAELVPPAPPGDFEQTLRDALGVLVAIVTWLLAALIVAAPFLVLAAVGFALERRRRRRADERLLEQAT